MSLHETSTAAGALPPRIYAEDLAPSLQMLLAALADIDFSYDRDLDRLRQSPFPEQRRRQIAQELEHQHRRDREPYVRRLAELAAKGRHAA